MLLEICSKSEILLKCCPKCEKVLKGAQNAKWCSKLKKVLKRVLSAIGKGLTDGRRSVYGHVREQGEQEWRSGESARRASHQCGPGSNPGVDAICGLSLLLVLSLAPRGFSPGTPVFPSP